MRSEGASAKAISEATGFHPAYVSTLVSKYIHNGLESIIHSNYGGNRRNMTFDEEEELLKQFTDDADGGHITDVSTIKAAYDKKSVTILDTDKYTLFCIDMDGQKNFPEANIRRVHPLRR